MKVRHVFLIVALIACAADAVAEGMLGSAGDSPPRVAALAVQPVAAIPPETPTTTSFPTYEPIPHLAPAPPKAPETTAAPLPTTTPPTTTPAPVAPTTTAPAPTPTSGAPPQVAAASIQPAPPTAVIARVKGARINVWNAPTDARPAFALLGKTEFGSPRVFLTTEVNGGWLRVMLALPPNGSEAWIRSDDVELSVVQDRIDVSLDARRLTWSRNGEVLLDAPIGIGAPRSPTPAHTYYVTDILPEDPRGPYGAWVVALNGYSESFATFEGGLPRLAIHGTNEPSSVGNAVSNGCVRVGAQDVATLAHGVPLGTPVFVT